MSKVELLSPGGSISGIRAAVAAGADAVYAGGSLFGARAYADNPDGEDMLEAIDFCHLHGVKFYLTVNTLLKDRELSDRLHDYILPLYEHGIDAVLVQDLGVFHFLRENFPDLPLHASTQMTITGAPGASLLQKMGASRVVLSRELSLEEIGKIRRKTDVELETFVHGALCYCYSGQCLMSSMIGGRSGNRGRCAQPCRLPWSLSEGYGEACPDQACGKGKSGYLLSLKDICTLQILPDLIEAGITSLKIEGRMKRPEYAAGVTSIYRKYIDLYREKGRAGYRVDPADLTALTDLFCRGGFSEGYYKQRSGPAMMASDRPDHSGTAAAAADRDGGRLVLRALEDLYTGDLLSAGGKQYLMKEDVKAGNTFSSPFPQGLRKGQVVMRLRAQRLLDTLAEKYVRSQPPVSAAATAFLAPGKPLIIRVSSGGETAEESGAIVQEADRRPLDEETVRKQIAKTGDTDFGFSDISIHIDGKCFCPVSEINRLRRQALESLKRRLLSSYRRQHDPSSYGDAERAKEADSLKAETDAGTKAGKEPGKGHPAVTASVMSQDQLSAVLSSDKIGGVYLDASMFVYPSSPSFPDAAWRIHESGKKVYLSLPYIWRLDTEQRVRHFLTPDSIREADGVLLRSIDQFGSLQDLGVLPGQEVIADAGVYTWNSEAEAEVFRLGATLCTVCRECTARELSSRNLSSAELIVYGRTPLMVTAQCLRKNNLACSHTPSFLTLKDRRNFHFPVKAECAFCTNIIFNSVPLDLVTAKEERRMLDPGSVRYSFTTESGRETARVLEGYLPDQITRGHIRKGVE